jgi:hypothetical protein
VAKRSTVRDEIQFFRNLPKAKFFEAMVAAMLEFSGYNVYPSGHETSMPALRMHFRQGRHSSSSATEQRLRAAPDLLVVDPEAKAAKGRTWLVEVKYRSWPDPKNIRLWEMLEAYHQHWSDATLVMIVPGGKYFYIQAVAQLKPGQEEFDLTKEFKPLPDIFKRVSPKTVAAFKADVQRFAEAFSKGKT